MFGIKPVRWIGMKDGGTRKMLGSDLVKHCWLKAMPAPSPNDMPPQLGDLAYKRVQPGKIPRHGEIVEVALHDC